MHLLVISDEIFPDEIGGVAKSLYTECVALARRGHQVTALVRAHNRQLPPEEWINGIRIVRFFSPPRHRWYYRAFPLLGIWQVTRWLRQHGQHYDVFYLHSAIYALQVNLAGLRRHTPVVHTFYAALDEYVHVLADRGKYGRLKPLAHLAATLLGKLERWAFEQASAVLPRSQFSLDELRAKFPGAKVPDADNLIPLCIDTDLYVPRSTAEARQQLGLPPNRSILITVRRLDGRMGLTNLIEAIAQVREHHPQVLLLIAGRGYLQPTLEALIAQHHLEDHVRLLGFVSEEQLPLYLASSDLFVLPTETLEGFGLATIEALASGVPVLGTPIGATPELLAPIHSALLTRDASPAALAEGVKHWLSRPQELFDLRAIVRHTAEIHYDSTVVGERLEELFAGVIEQHKAQS